MTQPTVSKHWRNRLAELGTWLRHFAQFPNFTGGGGWKVRNHTWQHLLISNGRLLSYSRRADDQLLEGLCPIRDRGSSDPSYITRSVSCVSLFIRALLLRLPPSSSISTCCVSLLRSLGYIPSSSELGFHRKNGRRTTAIPPCSC